MAVSIEVSFAEFQVPDHIPTIPIFSTVPCDCGCGCACCGMVPPNPAPESVSTFPVRYGTGEVILQATDLQSSGFGVPWGHTRSFASQLTQPANAGNGYNWQVADWSYLGFPSPSTVVVMGATCETLWFDQVNNAYVPRFNVRQTLLFNPDVIFQRCLADK